MTTSATATIRHSATLELNERIRHRRASGHRVLHLGFGEAGLPVLPEVGEVLAAAAGRNSYGAVGGEEPVRAAAAGYFTRRGLPTQADQVILAPGSKAVLFAALAVLPGEVVLPQPSWVSYAAQAALVGKQVVHIPVPASTGGVPDPQRLEDWALRRPPGSGPAVLVLTVPDNPTGTLPEPALVKRVCEIADRYGLAIVSDEIYRDLSYEPGRHLSPATVLPERTVVTGGLSKGMALGGWRIGVGQFPATAWGASLRADVISVASEIWSSLAAPMQAAAEYVFGDPAVVADHVTASRELHRRVGQAVSTVFMQAGATCRPPSAAFYCYPDFENLRPVLAAKGIHDGRQLAERLLDDYGVGVLPGAEFGDEPNALRFRAASSLLYGEGEDRRWEALSSDDPLTLPWIADALTYLRSALARLTGS